LPAAAGGIGPGSKLIIDLPSGTFLCTAGFVFNGADGTRYLGAAGHCFLPENKTATHGTGADYDAQGTTVRVCVAACVFGGVSGDVFSGTLVQLGPVAYARQELGDDEIGYDFGVVRIPSSLAAQVRPSMPVWGGPTGVQDVAAGSLVCHYGQGVGAGETFVTMARTGIGIRADDGAWLANAAVTPGDSGSALEVCAAGADGIRGQGAAGIVTHLRYAPVGNAAGTTLSRAVSLAAEANLSLTVATGQ
jgi:hypothetical protein